MAQPFGRVTARILTPWFIVLLKKLIVAQLSRKSFVLYVSEVKAIFTRAQY
jgi:hypothetical protein